MKNVGNMYLHIIDESNDQVIRKLRVSNVPRKDDTLRLSNLNGDECFYRVTRIVWVYDEPENPFERVNVGVIKD